MKSQIVIEIGGYEKNCKKCSKNHSKRDAKYSYSFELIKTRQLRLSRVLHLLGHASNNKKEEKSLF